MYAYKMGQAFKRKIPKVTKHSDYGAPKAKTPAPMPTKIKVKPGFPVSALTIQYY